MMKSSLLAALSLSSTVAFHLQAPRHNVKTSLSAGPSALAFAERAAPTGNKEKAISSGGAPAVDSDMQVANLIDTPESIKVQGGALRTWTFQSPDVDRILVSMNTAGPPEGTPLLALVELNQGPDNTPLRMKVKSGKGNLRPIRAVIETPGDGGSLFIRNTEALEFPFFAKVMPVTDEMVSKGIHEMSSPKLLQGGGAVTSYPLDSNVSVAKVMLKTDGRPLNAAIELTQGPNAVKVLIELYTEDGIEWPFYTLIETPGTENTIRLWSTNTVEFPLTVNVEPFIVSDNSEKDLGFFLVD